MASSTTPAAAAPIAETPATPPDPVPTTPRRRYYITALVLVLIGGLGGWAAWTSSDVKVLPVEGIEAFAILYVLAQAVERLNAILVPATDWVITSIGTTPSSRTVKQTAQRRLAVVRLQNRLLVSSVAGVGMDGIEALDAPADGEAGDGAADKKAVTVANVEQALLGNAFAFMLAMLAIGYFRFSLLGAIGYENVPDVLEVVITATAIMGGAAGLGDLIAKVRKQKEAAETAP